jgi:hypothetical protein
MTFSPQDKVLTAQQITKIIYIEEESCGSHGKCCLFKKSQDINVCGVDKDCLCHFSALVNYINSCSPEQLGMFLQYTTGSPVLDSFGRISKIYICLQKSECIKFPEARTCSKLLLLYDNEEVIDQEEFNKRIEYSINNCIAFGIR